VNLYSAYPPLDDELDLVESINEQNSTHGTFVRLITRTHYSVSQKKSPSWDLTFFHFFHKRLRIFNRFLHLLYVPIYTRSQIFIQLSPTLTKLCHIKRDYPVHIICSKCPLSAETHAFRRLRKLLIALLC